ncbi:hypothetical protein B0H14DRAFT_2619360 [Mycena olivaceomarginata]|nr:hypothetical protein B0H14DRAFT_2619360 [Mycena olivaceomarginata]
MTLLDIISCIPPLEYCAISGDFVLGRGSQPTHPLPPRWDTLYLDVLGGECLLDSLLLLPTPPALKSLEFGPNSLVSFVNNRTLAQFCSRAGASKKVSIHPPRPTSDYISFFFPEVEMVDQFVRSAPKLRNLKVTIRRYTVGGHRSNPRGPSLSGSEDVFLPKGHVPFDGRHYLLDDHAGNQAFDAIGRRSWDSLREETEGEINVKKVFQFVSRLQQQSRPPEHLFRAPVRAQQIAPEFRWSLLKTIIPLSDLPSCYPIIDNCNTLAEMIRQSPC